MPSKTMTGSVSSTQGRAMPDRVSATLATPPVLRGLAPTAAGMSPRAWPGDLCSSMHTTSFRGPSLVMYKATLAILLLFPRLPHTLYRV
jgi:hypothetical protein